MNKKEAIEMGKKMHSEGKKVFDCMFNEPCEPFLKEEVTLFMMDRNSFHWDPKKPNKIIDYTKQAIGELGLLAGIKPVNTHSIKGDNKFAYISTYESERKRPNGSRDILEAAYEYDAEIRFMTEEADDTIYGNGKYSFPGKGQDKGERYYEAMKKKRLAAMAQLARGKADTGAEKRAIIKLLKLPPSTTSENGQYKMLDRAIFISKVVPNLENSEMRQLFMSHTFGFANQIFPEQKVIPENPIEDDIIDLTSEDVTEPDPEQKVSPDQKTPTEVPDVVIIEQYLNSDLAANPDSKKILEWIVSEKSSYEEAIGILTDLSKHDNNPMNRATCIILLYKLHPSIKAFKMPGDNKPLLDHIDHILKNDKKLLAETIHNCSQLINSI